MGPLSTANCLENVLCDLCGTKQSRYILTRPDGLDVRECPECGLAFISPRLPATALNAIYTRDYFTGRDDLKEWDEQDYIRSGERKIAEAKSELQELAKAIDHIVPLRGSRVLDVGCGYGFFLQVARLRGAHAYGIDLSPEAVQYCQRRWDYPVELGTTETLDVGQFDIVTALGVIEHVPSPASFLQSLSKQVRPGGVVALTTPNYQLGRRLGSSWTGFRTGFEHVYFFDHASLCRIMERVGITVVAWYTKDVIPPSGDVFERARVSRPGLLRAKEWAKQRPVIRWLYQHMRTGFNAVLSQARVARGLGYELAVIGRRIQ